MEERLDRRFFTHAPCCPLPTVIAGTHSSHYKRGSARETQPSHGLLRRSPLTCHCTATQRVKLLTGHCANSLQTTYVSGYSTLFKAAVRLTEHIPHILSWYWTRSGPSGQIYDGITASISEYLRHTVGSGRYVIHSFTPIFHRDQFICVYCSSKTWEKVLHCDNGYDRDTTGTVQLSTVSSTKYPLSQQRLFSRVLCLL